MPEFTRLIRFLAPNGQTHYGEPIFTSHTNAISLATHARLITGDIFSNPQLSEQTAQIKRLLAPLDPKDVRNVRGIGLNYTKHAHESNLPLPKYPVVFHKSINALTGPYDDIPVPKVAQINGLDYECELVFIIGKSCKNVSEHEALNYVFGYTVGNDVSHRVWQHEKGGGQWCYSKSFDEFAPLGPCIVSSSILSPDSLKLQTRVNGNVVQDSSTKDMVFNVKKLIAFLSQGSTLEPGDVIFTGTPEGVGKGLGDGDVVEVSLENVGACRNRVRWEKGERQARL